MERGPWVDGKPTLPAPAAETRAVFDELIQVLDSQGATLAGHCVRTWLFIKDVDIFYQDMVDSRRALFEENGLTQHTHYIASTGSRAQARTGSIRCAWTRCRSSIFSRTKSST